MEVVRPSSETTASFSDLKPGNVFRSGGATYMRTKDVCTVDAYHRPLNAVDLVTGYMTGFYAHATVIHYPRAKIFLGGKPE